MAASSPSVSANVLSSITPIFISALISTPESTIAPVPREPLARVSSSEPASAAMPPRKAAGAENAVFPQTIAIAAPSVAPPDTPMISGAASGLANRI